MAFLVGLAGTSMGYSNAWASPVIPNLTDCKDNSLKPNGCTFDKEFTANQVSWIGSMHWIGSLFSSLFTGSFTAKFGRKMTILLLNLPVVLGWVLLTVTEPFDLGDPVYFYVGKFLTGAFVRSNDNLYIC